MKFLVLILFIVSCTFCQKPLPCTTPSQWEGRVFEYNEQRKFMLRGYFSYDAIYSRVRLIEEQVIGSDQEAYDNLYLYNQNVFYQFNLKTRECTKQATASPWINFGVPDNATSYGESYIGSSAVPKANLLTTIWGGNYTDPEGNKIEYTGVWSYEACLPISTINSNEKYGTTHVNFFDITPGISDPSRFIPRKECLGL